MQQQIEQQVNEEKLEKMAERTLGYMTGEMVSMMIYLGDKMGLYQALNELTSATPGDLAKETGLKERWLAEWLRGQAAAGLIQYEANNTFSLSPEAAVIFLDESHPFHLAGAFSAPVKPEELERTEEAFHTGIGITWDDHGPDTACMIKRFSAPSHNLLPEFLSRVDGLTDRLKEGIRVADVGCGAGVSLQVLARTFPNSDFVGYDPSPTAIEMARLETQNEGLKNITYHSKSGEELPNQPTFDLVMTLDCIHDMTQPREVIKSIRKSIKPNGVWIIKDIRCSDNFEENLENPMSPLFYSISVLYCMSAALSEPNGAGLGTMGFNPKRAEEMTKKGGFRTFEKLDIEEDPFNNFFAVYP